jgi:DNA-binding response OmpR family regulator
MRPLHRHILLVEGDKSNRELIIFFLRQLGYRVTCAGTSVGAFSLARSNYFNLYLLGDWLPFGEESKLCKQLHEFDPRCPILFLSAAASQADRRVGMNAGAQGYLTKPCDLGDLERAISRQLREAKVLSAAQTGPKELPLPGVNVRCLKSVLLNDSQGEG